MAIKSFYYYPSNWIAWSSTEIEGEKKLKWQADSSI